MGAGVMSGGREVARVLDDAGGVRAMIGVTAVMMFLTVLSAALGLATASAAALLDRRLAGRLTVQVIDGEPARRDAAAAQALAALRAAPEVARARPVPREELTRLLRPWLGVDAADAGLPIPALIDVDLKDEATAPQIAALVAAVSPGARVDRHARWMSPVGGLMRSVTLLAAGVVFFMAGATAAVVVLAARAGLEAHRGAIEVMHMLGSTDGQIARLFQRRIALDAAVGGAAGAAAALALVWAAGAQLAGIGSELIGGATLRPVDWALLAILPVAFAGLAMGAARAAVTRALRRMT